MGGLEVLTKSVVEVDADGVGERKRFFQGGGREVCLLSVEQLTTSFV
jgi:hypothetical protein